MFMFNDGFYQVAIILTFLCILVSKIPKQTYLIILSSLLVFLSLNQNGNK